MFAVLTTRANATLAALYERPIVSGLRTTRIGKSKAVPYYAWSDANAP